MKKIALVLGLLLIVMLMGPDPVSSEILQCEGYSYQRNCRMFGPGSYSPVTRYNLADNSISSFRIGKGASLTLCSYSTPSGRCVAFTRDISDLRGYTYSGSTLTANHTASSFKVNLLNR